MRIIFYSFVLLLAFAAYPNKGLVDSLLVEARELYSTNKSEAYRLEIEALKLATQLDYKEGLVKANYCLGVYFNSQGNLPSSITHYLEALRASSNLSDSTSLGWALFTNMNLSSIFREHQVHDLADDFTIQGVVISDKIGNTHQKIRSKFNLQKSYREQGRFEEALISLNEMAQLAATGSKAYFQAFNGIGLVHKESKEFETAVWRFKSQIPIALQENNLTYLSYAYQNLADTYFAMNNIKDAEENYLEAINIRLEIDSKNTNILFQLYQGLAALNMKIRDFEKARVIHLKTEALIPSVKRNPKYFYIYADMSKAYSELGDNDKAMSYSQLFQSELANFLEKQSKIKTASQQYSMRTIVSNYYEELETQRKEDQKEALFMAVIIGLGTMLFLFVGYHFASRYRLKRTLSLELRRLSWVEN